MRKNANENLFSITKCHFFLSFVSYMINHHYQQYAKYPTFDYAGRSMRRDVCRWLQIYLQFAYLPISGTCSKSITKNKFWWYSSLFFINKLHLAEISIKMNFYGGHKNKINENIFRWIILFAKKIWFRIVFVQIHKYLVYLCGRL